MKKQLQRLLLLAALLCVPWVTQAQSLSDYTLTTDTTTFTSIVSTGTAITLSSTDDGYGTCQLPFNFAFGESSLSSGNSICVCSNGYICLTGTSSSTVPSYSGATYRTICPLMAQDAHMGRNTGAGVYYQSDTTAGGVQCLTIEFHLLGTYSSPYGVYSYQVKLFENGNIEMVYDTMNTGTTSTRTLRTFLWDGPENELVALSGAWATPTMGTTIATRPNSPVPAHGLRYTFTRPVVTCPKVNFLTVNNVTTTSATINWQDTVASTWMVYYYPTDDNTMLDSAQVYDTTYSLTTLTANTSYTVTVIALCSDTESSLPRTLSFFTPCLPVVHDSLPYVENFDTWATGSSGGANTWLPDNNCWSYATNYVSTTNHYPYVSTSYAYSGTKSLYMYKPGTSYWADFSLPMFEDSVNTLMLSLYMRNSYGGNSNYHFQVGVKTDLNDPTSFTPVETLTTEVSNTWELKEIMLSTYTGANGYITLRAPQSSGYIYTYVDDVTVAPLPTCPRPANLVFSNMHTTSVDVQWTETGTATSWVVEYDTVDFTPGTTGNAYTEYSDSITLTGLLPGYTYYIAVHSDCGGGDTSYNLTGSFTLPSAEPVSTFPWTCDFTGESALGWDFENGTQANKWHIGSAAGYDGTGDSALYISNDNGSSNSYNTASTSNVYVARLMNLTAGQYGIQFNWKAYGESCCDYMYAFLVPATANYTAGTLTSSGTGWINLLGDRVNLQSSWQSAQGIVTVPSDGAYKLLFVWHNDGSVGTNPPAAVDNILMARINCPQPSNIVCDEAVDSLTFSWTPGGTEASWLCVLNGDTTEVTDTTIIYTGLASSSMYDFCVAAVCEDTSFFTCGTYYTECGPLTAANMPYTEDFESYGSGSSATINPCWYKHSTSSTQYPYPYSNNAISGNRSLYFYSYHGSSGTNYECYAVLPEIDASLGVNTLALTFDIKNHTSTTQYYPSRLLVGVMTDPTDITTFTTVQDIDMYGMAASTVQSVMVDFSSYTDTGRYICLYDSIPALRGSASYGYSYLYVDNIYLAELPDCGTPTDLTVTNITQNEADLSWSGPSTAIEYYVTYGPEDGTDTTITVSDTTVQLTDLMSNTLYHWSVRAYCGADSSFPMSGTSFRTACGAVTLDQLPYSYGFEDATSANSSGTIDPCWHKDVLNNTTQYPYPSSTAHTGIRSLYFYAYYYYPYKCWVATPEMAVSMDSLLVSFWNRSSSTSYSGIIKVGTMSDPTDLSTFNHVASCRPNGTTWTLQEVPMATTDTGRYIAFLVEMEDDPVSQYYNYAYLDDITIDLMPSCYHVMNLEVGGTTPGGAVITWGATPSDASASYLVEYRADSTNTWTAVSPDVTENSYTFTGLDAGTLYHVRVAALCSAGDSSDFQYTEFTTGTFGCAEVDTTSLVVDTIGTGTSTMTGIPVNSSWGNTICQSIYLASELIAGGFDSTGATITDIAYTWQNNSSYAKEFTIYMNNSTQSTYSSYTGSNWVSTGAAAQVYTGDHPIGTSGTVTYHLDTPFQWDGVSNLVITTTMNQPAGQSHSISSFYGYSTSCGATRTVYQYRDASAFDGSNPAALSNSGSTSQYRPNIILTSAECTRYATCAAPAVAASYVGPDTVILTWAAGANETDWNLYYRVGTSGAFTFVENVSDMTYTFENLQPATTYTFRVETVCDPDTFAADLEVTTGCARVSTINEDFEPYMTGTGGSINPCWTKHVQGTTTQYPYVNSIDGTKALYFYGYNSNNSTRYYCWAATPEMLDSLSTYELEFDMRRTSTSAYYTAQLIIGAMTDPDNFNTFDTIEVVNATTSGVWENKYVSLENYHDTSARYIAFLSPSPDLASGYTYTYNYVYLDNVYIGRRSNCPRPSRFHARDITANSAELTWDGSEDHMSATVKWGTTNDINAATDSVEVYTNSVVLNSLNATTTYYAWITAQCNEEGSRTYNCSFTTTAACNSVQDLTIAELTTTTASITWDDDDVTPATGYTFMWKADSALTWNVVNTTNRFYFLRGLTEGTAYNVSVTAICSADSAVAATLNFTTASSGVIGGSTSTLVMPTYPYYEYSISEEYWTPSELNDYGDTVNGIYFNSAGSINDRVTKIWVIDTTISDLSTSNYIPSTDMTLVFDSTYDITTGWNYFPFNAPYVRDHNNHLVVLATDSTGDYDSFTGWYGGDAAGTSLFGYQDGTPYSTTNLSGLNTATSRAQMRLNANLVTTTCSAPHVVAADATGNSITLAWIAGLNETSWTVDYRVNGDTVWTNATASTTDTFATVNGLNPSTQYQFRVGSLCTGDTQYASILAYTACGTYSIPYLEDFNSYSSNTYEFNACWYYGNASSTNMPYTVNITGQGMMMLMPVGSYVIFPALNEPINSLQLRCDYVVADTNIYSLVGICSHPHDYLSMTVIDTLWATANGVPEQVVVPFGDYLDTGGYICIFSSYNQTYYDNVRIELIPACPMVDSLMATNITTTTAEFTWLGGANASSYLVEYGVVGSDSTTTVTTTNNYITLTGLHHSTSYEVRVSTICAALGDTSLASNPYGFMTNCAPLDSLPYFEDFDHCNAPALTYTGILPNCWSYQTLATGSYAMGNYLPQIYNSSTYASSGNYCLMLYGKALTILPEMPTSIDSLMISFHHYNTSPSYYDMVIGVCDSNTPGCEASFVPIDTIQSTSNSEWYTSYDLASYTGNGRYIAFMNYYRTSSTVYYSYHYIDDITVDYLPTCLPVQNVHAAANTSTSVELTWDDLRPATEWEIAYSTSPMSDPSTGTTVVTTTKPYTVTGLGDSMYYFYVRTICGTGDTSIWSNVFSTRPGIWVMRNGFTDTLYMCSGHIYDDGGPSGNYSNSANGTIILMPSDTMHRVRISGSWISESCCDYLGIYDGIGTSGTQFYRGYAGTSGITVGPFESTTGPLTITFTADGSVNYAGFDLTVECAANYCAVRNIRTDTSVAQSSTAIAVTWDGSSPEYTVVYGPAGFDMNDSTANTMTVFTNHAVLPGLVSMANYDVYVRGICDAYGIGGSDTGSFFMATLQVPMCDNVTEILSYDSTMSAGSNNYVPIGYSFYNYGYVQTIIDSARLAGLTDDIAAWAFSSVNGTQGSYYNHIDVYFANVSETNLSSGFIHPDSNHVFVQVLNDADLRYTEGGWHMHGLDTVFTWDGHSNLLVSVSRRHGSYSSGASFNTHTGRTAQSRYIYQDGSAYNPSTVSGGTTTNAVGDMKFFACGEACGAPVITGVTYDYESATITWTGSGSAYEVAIKEAVALDWPTEVAVTGNTYTFNGLSAATNYMFRVRQDCSADSLGYSDWVVSGFTTDSLPCMAPDSLVVNDLTNAQGTFSWNVNGFETQWDLHVWTSGGLDSVYRVTTNPATVGGFTAGVSYNAAIRPICGSEELEGDYSDTITFTTLTCPDVTGLTTSNVTSSSVTLNWTADAMAESWMIEYGFRGFAQGTGTSVTSDVNTYVVTDLDDETAYDFYVKAVCGTDWNSEGWTQVTATTLTAEDPTYTVTVNVNDDAMGSATGGGTFHAGESCTVTATANDGYHFVNWSNGETANPYTFTVVANITLTANFAADEVEGIEDVNGNALCTIYPNPTSDVTTISVSGVNGKVRIAVVDMNGRTVASETLECSSDCEKTMDVDKLAQGAYFVKITGENVNMVKKLVVR